MTNVSAKEVIWEEVEVLGQLLMPEVTSLM